MLVKQNDTLHEDTAFLYNLGYDYGAIATYANQWDCSFEEAIVKLAKKLKVY